MGRHEVGGSSGLSEYLRGERIYTAALSLCGDRSGFALRDAQFCAAGMCVLLVTNSC